MRHWMIACALLVFVSAVHPASPGVKTSWDCAKFLEIIWPSDEDTAKLLGHLLARKQFETFEEAASCLLASRQRFENGRTGPSAVYLTLRRKLAPAEDASANQQLIKEWRQSIPDSWLAAFADARLSYASAWNVRGNFGHGQTPRAQLEEFHRLLRETEKKLNQAPAKARDTPLWHNLMLATLHDLPAPAIEPYTVFETAISRWPTYFDFYEVQVSRLTPQWGGDWDVVESFIIEWTENLRATEGESTYARLYISLLNQTIPQRTHLNWNRMKASLEDLSKRFPTVQLRQLTTNLACQYGDLDLLRSVLKRDGKPFETLDWLSSDAEARCYQMIRAEFPTQLPIKYRLWPGIEPRETRR